MATIHGIWHGGDGNYSPADPVAHLERFESVTAARHALMDRHGRGAVFLQSFDFVNAPPGSFYTPVVGEDCSIWLYLGAEVADDGTVTVADYPDLIVTLNAEGVAEVEPA